jgi:hypothetical protein
MRLLGRSFGAENVNKVLFFQSPHRLQGTMFLCCTRFHYCDFRFQLNGISFYITCHLISLFAMKERKKILPFVVFFNRHFRVALLFIVLFCSCGGDLSDLLPVLLSQPDKCFNYLFFHKLSARSPSQTITIMQIKFLTKISYFSFPRECFMFVHL